MLVLNSPRCLDRTFLDLIEELRLGLLVRILHIIKASIETLILVAQLLVEA